MLAVPATDLPPDDARWAYEMKWDGMRALVGVERGDVWATSRAGNDATARFPELAGLADALGDLDALLDGEIVALDDAGVPRFERLQPRMQAGSAAAIRRGIADQAVVYMVFDVLWLDGHSTCELPYTDRRAVLERLGLAGPAWQTPPTAYGTGAARLETAQQLGLEGVVAKRRDSTYLPGSGPTPGARSSPPVARSSWSAVGSRARDGSNTASVRCSSATTTWRTAATCCASPAASAPASTVPSAIASRRSCGRGGVRRRPSSARPASPMPSG